MKHALVISLLATWGCAATGPEREAQAIKTAIDSGRLGCGLATTKRVELTAEQRAWCEGRK
jgi:hypothetical protein